ncbi:CPBP family intramembrane glutamic endopeptidase [Mariniluteicoccus flavus]
MHEIAESPSAQNLGEPGPSAPDQTRRRAVVAVTLVVGAGLLWWSLGLEPGDTAFYGATLALAAVWAGGAFASGPIPLGEGRRPGAGPTSLLLPAFVLGLLLLAVFLVGALVVSQIPLLAGPVDGLLDHARRGSLALVLLSTVINGFAEETFFRGALYAAVPTHLPAAGYLPVAVTTAVYALSTIGSGVPLLVFAAVLLGLVTALQRRATGGVLAPMITHVTWSTGMLLLLPPVLEILR